MVTPRVPRLAADRATVLRDESYRKRLHKTRKNGWERKDRRRSAGRPGQAKPHECRRCGAKETPHWRPDTTSNEPRALALCNACFRRDQRAAERASSSLITSPETNSATAPARPSEGTLQGALPGPLLGAWAYVCTDANIEMCVGVCIDMRASKMSPSPLLSGSEDALSHGIPRRVLRRDPSLSCPFQCQESAGGCE